METIVLRQPASLDQLQLDNGEPRPPGPGEIQVRIRAASLNFRDSLVVSGFFPTRDGLIPLSDAAGEVVATGEGVSSFAIGDRVVSTFHPSWADGHIERSQLNATPGGPADGYACELATRSIAHFTHAPRGWTATEASTLPCAGVTAWRALVTDGGIKPGARVLVMGTGGVSLFALQLAKAHGATVIATSSSEEKLARLEALGADHVIDYKKTPEWGALVQTLSGGIGVDHVVEVGGPATLAQSFVAARTGGHIALIGAVSGFAVDTMPFAMLQAKRLRVQGVTVGSRADQTSLIAAVEGFGIKPVIDSVHPLHGLASAFRRLQSGQHFGKVCIEL
jgi:NADPH:quinone reductase-like Zn-dependent oxidoreductase